VFVKLCTVQCTRDGTGSGFLTLTRDPTRPDLVVKRSETDPRQWLDSSISYLSEKLKQFSGLIYSICRLSESVLLE